MEADLQARHVHLQLSHLGQRERGARERNTTSARNQTRESALLGQTCGVTSHIKLASAHTPRTKCTEKVARGTLQYACALAAASRPSTTHAVSTGHLLGHA
eukprot:2216274-Rhodomonas_salina.1